MKKIKTTVCNGIIGNFTKNPDTNFGEFNNNVEKAREKKHLKAYLAGHERFVFGKDEEGYPQYYPVKKIAIEA